MLNNNNILDDFLWMLLYSAIGFGFFASALYFLLSKLRKKNLQKHQYGVTFLEILLPRQNESQMEDAEHLFSSLSGLRTSWTSELLNGPNRISFEIVSKKSGIGFYVVVPDELVVFVEKQINAAYESAEIDIIDPNEVWDRGDFTSVAEVKLAGAPYLPIKTYKEFGENDPLNSLTSAISKLSEDEVIAIQFLISPSRGGWQRAGQSFIGHVKSKSADTEKGGASVDTSILEGVETKLAKPGFDVSIRIVSIAKDATHAENHISSVMTAFEQFTNVKHNRFRRYSPMFRKKLVDNIIYRRHFVKNITIPIFEISLYRNCSTLNTEELATVFHFPNKEIKTPNIFWLGSRKAAAPANVPTEGLYLGKNIARGVKTDIHMAPKDRNRHFYIIGQTGTGKSVFMSSLALQDIENGHGLAYIDPHGSEIDKLLEEMPKHRLKDVILFDPSDKQRPMGLNILEAKSLEEKNMVVNAFIALLYKMYDPNRTGIMGPKLERAIRNVMLTAMEDPQSTLIDVLRLLIDKKYQEQFLPLIKDPLVKRYWTDEMASTSDFHKGEQMGYFVSKFDRFVTEHLMRNILGQPKSAFDFPTIMAERKILLVDLAKGKIGEENSNFLGLILVPKILQAALSRANLIGKEEFPDFFLYVDEFQNFATPDFATILSEARKYKLNLTVAHQFVSQLTDDIKEAIFGNVGSMAVFRIGAEDSAFMEPQFEPIFSKNDMINNSIGNAYLRLLINGHPSVPFSLKVDWEKISSTPHDKEVANQIREFSRNTYGHAVEEVEAYIKHRIGFEEQEKEEQIKRERKKALPF